MLCLHSTSVYKLYNFSTFDLLNQGHPVNLC